MFLRSDFFKLPQVASLRVVSGSLFHNLQVVTVTMGQVTLKFAYLVRRELVSLERFSKCRQAPRKRLYIMQHFAILAHGFITQI